MNLVQNEKDIETSPYFLDFTIFKNTPNFMTVKKYIKTLEGLKVVWLL